MSNPLVTELIDAMIKQRLSKVSSSHVVPLKKYCELHDTTPEAIRQRLSKGIWQVGLQVLEIEGTGRWVDLDAVDAWARKQGQSLYRQDAA